MQVLKYRREFGITHWGEEGTRFLCGGYPRRPLHYDYRKRNAIMQGLIDSRIFDPEIVYSLDILSQFMMNRFTGMIPLYHLAVNPIAQTIRSYLDASFPFIGEIP